MHVTIDKLVTTEVHNNPTDMQFASAPDAMRYFPTTKQRLACFDA